MTPDKLTAAALVGTERADLPAAADVPPALAGFFAALSGRPAEEKVLLLAGALTLHQSAGRLPDRAAATDWRIPAFRPEGDRPPCSPAAARLLERMLNQQDAALLPELLGLIDRAGRRAPDVLLPAILERGAKTVRLRPLLLPIVGERGRWLGSINPAWRYAAVDLGDPHSLRAAWEADPPGRAALAQMVRRKAPEVARRLIESTWRTESDATRREVVAQLEAGLSPADELFLERALDDRNAHVRQKAAALLAAIPDSRLLKRMAANAGDILALDGGRLAPVFPARVSDEMVRDGVTRWRDEVKSDGKPSAPRTAADWSRMLIQTVGAISLRHWETKFGAPETIVHAAIHSKWPRTILTALSTAALRQSDRRWIKALLEADGYSERSGMLLAVLEPADCYAQLAAKIAAGEAEAVIVFMRRWPHEWDEASGALLLDFLGRMADREPEGRAGPTLRFLSRSFALRCPPSLAEQAAETLDGRGANNTWKISLGHVVRTLRLRQELREAVKKGDMHDLTNHPA
jgi:hypothetical protein